MYRRLLAAAFSGVVLAGLLMQPALATIAPLVGDDRVTFGVGPAGPSGPDPRPFLTHAVAPGSEVFDHVAVLNQSDVPLTLLVYAGDGLNTEAGGLDITKRADRNTDLGAWVTLGPAVATGRVDPSARSTVTVTVPPQSARTGRGTVIVPVRIAVPADATPGDHVGGIAVALLSRGNSPAAQNIELEQRVVARVYLRVSGTLSPALATTVLSTEYAGGSGLGLSGTARVTYRITNTGNTRVGAIARVGVHGPFGIGRAEAAGPSIGELVPGGSAVVTTEVHGARPTVLAQARVKVTAQAVRGTQLPTAFVEADSRRFWAVTWQEVVVLLVLLLAAGGGLRKHWRREPKGRHVRPNPAPDPAVRAAALRRTARPVVVLLVLAFFAGGGSLPRADAAVLGSVQVAPASGQDQTLFSGQLQDAACPARTADTYWSIDGPGLPRDQAILAPGNTTGTGPQSFQGASIANLKSINAGSFLQSGTYTVRFNCVRSPDGVVTDAYEISLRYVAGGAGAFTVPGGLRTLPPLQAAPVPTPTAPARSLPPSGSGPALATTPSEVPSVGASGAAADAGAGTAVPKRVTERRSISESYPLLWGAGAGVLLVALVLVRRRRRTR